MNISDISKLHIEKERLFGAHNYHPLEVVLSRGSGIYVWDVDGNRYFDFLSAYSAVNQGHCHPAIINALVEQANLLTLTSRAFYNDRLGNYQEMLHNLFGYDKMLPVNSGAEAVESALKLARKWGYLKKGIPQDEAIIIVCEGNFHGRTIAVVSLSTDPSAFGDYGPLTPGFVKIPFGDSDALAEALKKYGNKVAAFLTEPVQGEAGVKIPPRGYLKRCRELCNQYNILLLADEVQTGIARTGRMLCCDHEGIRPDMVILGKALSGGVLPVSAVLADDEIMLNIKPGEHGSTFGGFPLACAVSEAALRVVIDEKLAENAEHMGGLFRSLISEVKSPFISEVRGLGLLNAIVINPYKGKEAWDVCEIMASNGLLAKPTHRHIIRFAPPLIINENEIREAAGIIIKSIKSLE
jgi:ornithine--oxo-acid transaminase